MIRLGGLVFNHVWHFWSFRGLKVTIKGAHLKNKDYMNEYAAMAGQDRQELATLTTLISRKSADKEIFEVIVGSL